MKKLLIAFLITISLPIFGNAQKINWMTFQEAVKLNETAPKKIFIDVFTDWCGWCKRMDQTTFINKEVVDYMNENFYAVKFDAEMNDTIFFSGYKFVNEGNKNGRKGTHQLAISLLQGKMSYPSYVFMNEKNQLLMVAPGYMEAKDFLPVLKYFGTDAYLKQTYQDFIKK
ncbi:MAG: DUF255 domain-containing protein [Bacteroidales bacterium]|nr:DUF255 domain-containing protein [Bacteroidales bacterium]